MSTKLLSDRIRELHLRPDAPYPSEVRDGRDMVRQWRHNQRLHLIESNPVVDLSEEQDDGNPPTE